jgi:thiol-disulfide isomerase/thioredoxin
MVTDVTMHDVSQILDTGSATSRGVVLMFYGATCGPCKATMPYYDEVSEYFREKNTPIDFYKINAWEPAEQSEYCKTNWSINGVPQFKIFYDHVVLIDRPGGGEFNTLNDIVVSGVDAVFTNYGDKL